MYYSKTAALDRHVCELHRIITKVEPKAPQKNASTENKCKMSKRELNNRIERLVLLAYTLRRKTTNEPFVPATEQEWAHLYMNGMCVKKYYTCQGRQVYVPKKIADSTGRGCDNRSGKYDKYLTDCGGKGSGGSGKGYGGGGSGGSAGSSTGGGAGAVSVTIAIPYFQNITVKVAAGGGSSTGGLVPGGAAGAGGAGYGAGGNGAGGAALNMWLGCLEPGPTKLTTFCDRLLDILFIFI